MTKPKKGLKYMNFMFQLSWAKIFTMYKYLLWWMEILCFWFKKNSSEITKLLTPYLGEAKQLFKLKKKRIAEAKKIIKTINKYYKMLPNPLWNASIYQHSFLKY